MKRRPAPNAGFTLLEMLVVATIIGLALGVYTPSFAKKSDTMRLEQAARNLTDALKLARSRAILNNIPIDFYVDTASRTLGVENTAPLQLPSDFGVELLFAETLRQNANTGALRFYTDGSSSGGEIRLKLTNHAADVKISWITGTASITP